LIAGAIGAIGAGCRPAADPNAVVVGSSPTGVPFTFIDPRSNNLTGALIDIVGTVSKIAELPIRFEIVPFAALIPSLTARKIDIICAAILRTPDRERVVSFTDPVYAYGGGVVVPAKEMRVTNTLADLQGRRVGAQVGTSFVGHLRDAGVDQIATYDSLSDILRDLSNGRIDAAYGDEPILAYQLHVYQRPNLRLVQGFTTTAHQDVCFILRQGDSRIERLNAAIATTKAGLMDPILNRWNLAGAAKI
jgi:polar amino acid transport system substrate-binding protein